MKNSLGNMTESVSVWTITAPFSRNGSPFISSMGKNQYEESLQLGKII